MSAPQTTTPNDSHENSNTSLLLQTIQETLAPWQTSQKTAWKYTSRVPNIPTVQVDRGLFQELTPECWTSGESVTTFLDIWHSREYMYNPTNAAALRIANTYLYPSIQRAVRATGSGAGSDYHRVLVDTLVNFRYKARKDLPRTLHDLFTAYDYLAIPLHVSGNHWALAIIVHVNSIARLTWTPGQGQALIFLLDSLSGATASAAVMRAGQDIRRWLIDVLQVLLDRHREETAFQIIHIPETAQQPNGSDCGLYVHHHLRTFISTSNPERIVPHYQGNGGLLSNKDLVELWRYPSALDCRFNVMQMVISELKGQGNEP